MTDRATKSLNVLLAHRYAVAAFAWVAYIALFLFLYVRIGQPANALVALPVILTGWLLGARWGLVIGTYAYPLNILLFFLVHHPDMQTIITKGIPPTIALLVIGWVVGRLRDLQEKLKERILKIEELQKELRELATRDPLTGLFNRRYLHETLEREIARAARMNTPVSILLMDLDSFKLINDNHGHLIGDLMLKSIGNLISENMRVEDIPCRFGGEEFLLVMPGVGSEVAVIRAEAIRRKIEAFRLPCENTELSMTVSIGISVFPLHSTSMDGLLHLSDQALYQAKEMGKNRVFINLENTTRLLT